MKFLLSVIDDLLKAYEHNTPCIDQALVNRVLIVRECFEKLGTQNNYGEKN